MKKSLQFKGRAIFALTLFLLVPFQNCVPTKFGAQKESFETNERLDFESQAEVIENNQTQAQDALNQNSQTQAQVSSNSTRRVSTNRTTDLNNENPNAVEIPDVSDNSDYKIGLSTMSLSSWISSGIVMSEDEGSVLQSYFPNDPRNSRPTGKTEWLALDAELQLVGQSVDVCISKEAAECNLNSNFRTFKFQSVGSHAQIILENFWQTTRLREFADYHIVVKNSEFTRRALIKHRVYISYSQGGLSPSGTGFYSATVGPNHYGFICEVPPIHEQGWTLYPYGSFANTAVKNNPYLANDCYYRVLINP